MLKTTLAVTALAAAALIGTATFDTAEARRGGHGGAHGHRSHHAHVHHRHHGVRHHRRVYIASPVVYYGSSGGCGWLKQRAIVTGSSYWWHRWQACRYGY